jgi:hypothetical protein
MSKIKHLSVAAFTLLVGMVSNGAIAGESRAMTKGVIVGDNS